MRRAALTLAAATTSAVVLLALPLSPGAPATRTLSVVCNGKERWPVKTMSDRDAAKVDFDPAKIRRIAVKDLRLTNKPLGADAPNDERIAPVETTIYELKATLIEARWIWNRNRSTPLR